MGLWFDVILKTLSLLFIAALVIWCQEFPPSQILVIGFVFSTFIIVFYSCWIIGWVKFIFLFFYRYFGHYMA